MGFLEGPRMTIVGGIALAASLALMLAGMDVVFDPAWVTVAICGLPLLYLALTRLLLHGWISSALLISMAMAACIWIGQLFAAGEVAFIMAIGEILENRTVDRAKRGITSLMRIAPDRGRLVTVRDGVEKEEMVPVEGIGVGDVLRVLPGERIPVDGEVVSGSTSVDQSVMTGESLPVDRTEGDKVFRGTMNCFGSVDVRTLKACRDSSLQRMVDLAREAENRKAPTQRIVDRWASWLVPIALAIAVAGYFITGELERAVTVLVVFCPCALALATPVSIVAGIGQATKFGVLVKSGEALERMGGVDCVAFDKTGTLTEGTLTVSDVVSLSPGMDAAGVLALTASVEARSGHPIGKAILGHARRAGLPIRDVEGFRMVPGKGIRAMVGGEEALAGSAGFLRESGVHVDDGALDRLDRLRGEGKASVLTSLGGRCVGLLALSDMARPSAGDVVGELHAMGAGTVMLTGDSMQAASHLASALGIGDVRAELLPSEKVSVIASLQAEGRKVCMVGDGVNDAPALKAADVSVAMGGMGSDIAMDSADIALMGDDISRLPYLKRLSVAVIRSIRLNITISMAINLVAVTLSLLGLLGPVSGALVHNAGSVLVVLNAALLYDRKV